MTEDNQPPEQEAEPQTIEELRAALTEARRERDRAEEARDAIVREVLPLASGSSSSSPSRAGRMVAIAVTVALLVGVAALVRQMIVTARVVSPDRKRPVARAPSPRRAHKKSRVEVAPKGRLVTIPVTGLSVVGRAALAPDGRHVAVAGWDGKVLIIDLASDRALQALAGHRGAVRALAFTPDGKRLVTGGAGGAVYVWDWRRGARTGKLRQGGSGVRDLAVSAKLVALAAEQPEVEILPFVGATARRLVGHSGWVRAVAITPDGRRLASGGSDGIVRVWSLPGGSLVDKLEHRTWINALAYRPDGKRLAVAAFDKRIHVWDLERRMIAQTLRGHVRRAVDLEYSASGSLLVSASLDRTVVLWNALSGQLARRLRGHRYRVSSVGVAAGARFVLSASTDGTLRLWPLPLPLPQVRRRLGAAREGELTFRVNVSGERLRIKVVDADGKVLPAALSRLAYLLRSGPDDRQREPDRKLVQLLYRVASHFGRRREVIVISGYRSPEFNALRRRQSREVARNSRHVTGEAIDFRLEGVPINTLYRYVRRLRAGGVGYYPDSKFIHIDSGPVRTWKGT